MFARFALGIAGLMSDKQRTGQQQKSIEVYCRELAKAFTDAGLDQRKVFEAMKEGVEIPWHQDAVKEEIWRRMQIWAVEKQSTADLDTDEVSIVYDIVNRWTSDRFGISVLFPDRHTQGLDQ
jgi:hypothetical protein